ncbi:MoaD/ThiS family protein [Pseudonocardia endophytica]|uniref:Molybdopterin synthase sulfur carrier subunit n=1 Tax=Pseudonocardia endophytica TaxID=401976 RepID=A0A4R1HET4_PSEEN|nr:MoaD/ThiS family protein [Pseudonocardia endophytica]TCK20128.1 molybdopterin converting factor small subunit [Pseudonocardia endophytica]
MTTSIGIGTRTVTVRYFAAAKAAAGTSEETVELPTESTLDDVLGALRAGHGPELTLVLQRCSFLVDEVAARRQDLPLGEASTVDVLPPFAGG